MVVAMNYKDQRKLDRIPLMLDASVTLEGNGHACKLLNICARGAKIQLLSTPFGSNVSTGDIISLNIPKLGEFDGTVAWSDDEYLGIRFDENHKAIAALISSSAST